MDKVRFAVLGYGHIGKRHADIIRNHNDGELIAVIDHKFEAAHYIDNGVHYFNALENFFAANLNVDVVNVCTPNGLHATQATQCVENGSHTVVEKPIGLKREEVDKLILTALNKGKQVFPVVQNRYSKPIAWLKKLIDAGDLGDVFSVHLNCFWNRDERYYTPNSWHGNLELDGGPVYTQFSHFIDIMLWIFGGVSNINAKFFNFNHKHNTDFEDSGTITFDFLKHGSGTFNYSTSIFDENFESSITVLGSLGTVKIGGQYMNKLEYAHVNGLLEVPKFAASVNNNYGGYSGSAANHHFVIDNVIQTILGKSEAHVLAREGTEVVYTIEEFYKSRKLSLKKVVAS